MNNRACEASPAQFALWNRKTRRTKTEARHVLVVHADEAIGASLAQLLALKGFGATHAIDVSSTRHALETHAPQAVFLDTRIGGPANHELVRELRELREPAGSAQRLIIAMSGMNAEEPIAILKDAGYDGHCRRPCPMWQLTDLLDGFFACRMER